MLFANHSATLVLFAVESIFFKIVHCEVRIQRLGLTQGASAQDDLTVLTVELNNNRASYSMTFSKLFGLE